MTSSFAILNHVGNGTSKANGIDGNNIIEARRQFQNGAIRAAHQKNHPQIDAFYYPSSALYIAQLSKSWEQPSLTSTANINARPLRDTDRIPVLLENSALIYACVSALQQHLGLSKAEIRDIADNGGLDMDFINSFAPDKIAALYDELQYDAVA
jgi:hypothetical protein